jgi:hypothetical protein
VVCGVAGISSLVTALVIQPVEQVGSGGLAAQERLVKGAARVDERNRFCHQWDSRQPGDCVVQGLIGGKP